MANEVQVIGIKLGTGKTGNPSNTLCYTRLWSDFDLQAGAEGLWCENRWTTVDLSGLHVGDVIELIWEPGFNGVAVLRDYKMLKPADPKK